jgi:hypothetical protein
MRDALVAHLSFHGVISFDQESCFFSALISA